MALLKSVCIANKCQNTTAQLLPFHISYSHIYELRKEYFDCKENPVNREYIQRDQFEKVNVCNLPNYA